MKKNFLKEMLQFILTTAILVFILLKFVLLPCVVDGTSMYPTLEDNDFGYSFIFSRNLGIERFHIVVIRVGEDKLLVKRVIGLPTETIRYENDQLYVNDEPVAEDFLQPEVHTGDLEIRLGEDEYFCMGDNRSVSRDSRYYGPFSGDKILSEHILVIYPFKDIGLKK